MARRTTDTTSIVIVCEGSETEYRYFRDLKRYVERTAPDRFAKIHIVPVESEIIKVHNPERPTRGKMRSNLQTHYWCLYDISEAEYNKYKAQPTRYIREAYLYMVQEGFTEAWAVYDKDVHAEHETAYSYAQTISNMNVAFSAYSFEEWLLVHFERNANAYMKSDCKKDKISILCGTNQDDDDCHGTRCIAGRLRNQKYIPNYTKTSESLFDTFTLARLNTASINAAWLRHLSNEEVYERNPYTDVDRLVLRMLGEPDNPYMWCSISKPLKTKQLNISLEFNAPCYTITNNSSLSLIIKPSNISFLDENYREVIEAIDSVYVLRTGDSIELTPDFPFVQYSYGEKKIIFDVRYR